MINLQSSFGLGLVSLMSLPAFSQKPVPTQTKIPNIALAVSDKFKGKSKQGLFGDVVMEIDWSVGEIMKALQKNKINY